MFTVRLWYVWYVLMENILNKFKNNFYIVNQYFKKHLATDHTIVILLRLSRDKVTTYMYMHFLQEIKMYCIKNFLHLASAPNSIHFFIIIIIIIILIRASEWNRFFPSSSVSYVPILTMSHKGLMYQIFYKTKLFDDFNDCLTPASSIIR